jgi:hypothetical protein
MYVPRMAKPFDKWTVLPHKPVVKLADNLWMVEGRLGPIHRVMVMVRLSGNRLVIWNPVALDEPEMKELEAWGTPAFLIVPNAGHRMDSRIWKQRYPSIVVIAPPGGRKKIEEIVAVDRTDGDLGDASVTLTFPECTAGREALMTVKHADGNTTIVINDLVMNSRHGRGFSGLMFRMLGFTSKGPSVTPAARLFLVKDKPGLKTLLQQLAATPQLGRVIVSHGHMLEAGAAEGLREAVDSF